MSTNSDSFQNLPADLQGVLRDLDRADEEASQLVNSLSDQHFNWQPDSGRGWSVGQCLDHLAQTNALYTAALSQAAGEFTPAQRPRKDLIKPGWLGRWFIGELEPPPKRKLKAQKKVMPPLHLNSGTVLKAFIAAHDQTRRLVQQSRDLDLNRIRFRNPFLRLLPWTIGTGLLVIGAHDRRHLWQARQVLAAMERALDGGGVQRTAS